MHRRLHRGQHVDRHGLEVRAVHPRLDAEGNEIVEHGGHWHLAWPPKSLSFPIAGGYRFQLLPINPNASYTALRARIVAIQAEQLAIANSLKGDMKYWFAKVYYFVTTHELAAIDAGTYLYPHMKMQEVVQFQAAYKSNLDAWQAGNKAKVEAHWKAAFGAADSENGGTWYKPRSMELMNALLPSMQAPIRFDLPRAIAACYVLHYAGIPGTSIGDFKADFDGMGPDSPSSSVYPRSVSTRSRRRPSSQARCIAALLTANSST